MLEISSTCKHWCLSFALSNPDKPAFSVECGHENTDSDKMCDDLEDMFCQITENVAACTSSNNTTDKTELKKTGLLNEAPATTLGAKLVRLVVYVDLLQKRLDKGIGHLMIYTVQDLLFFRLNDECAAPHHPGVFYIDYMMKIRTLLFNEMGIDFHMIMGKGNSVIVGGLSYHGIDDKRVAAKCEDGDYVLHHTVTVGSDATQGGAET